MSPILIGELMTNPIQRNQNISSYNPLPNAASQNHSGPRFRDRLQMHNPSIFTQIWNVIANSFRSLFSCFTAPSIADLKTRIEQIANRDHFIWFYKKEENAQTAFLGNFHPCKIQLWGMSFQCAEAAFQAAKFSDLNIKRQFQRLDGDAAFRLGRRLTQNWQPSQHLQWRANNLSAMQQVLQAKFSQNPDLKELLLATGDAYLVEHIPVKGRDAFWGDDSDGTGQNHLGIQLMQTRAQIGGSGLVSRNVNYNAFLRRE